MNFIVPTKGAILFLDKEGQLMDDRVRGRILIGIPEHGKVFGILVVGITWKYLICLVGRMDIKDKDPVLIEGIVDFFKDVPYFHLVLHIADRIGIAGYKVISACL